MLEAVAEKLLLALLLVASLLGFWWRFGAVLRKIRAAKPDADFSLFPLGPRIRELVWDVMVDVAAQVQPQARSRVDLVVGRGVQPGAYVLVTAHRA